MPDNLVIVESPAKAKTINKYLGDNYKVIASFGHVRDLPAKNNSVRPDEDFAMDWEMSERASKPVGEILALAKKSKTVFLATDPDREGEAISWHIMQVLKEKNILGKVPVRRVTFNEITKTAITEAFENARDLDLNLVDAYLARRALDYLVGFTLSPVLWRKLPGARSAGRVQSVALRMICERELEIEAFKNQEYWSIESMLSTAEGKGFTAKLSQLDGKKIEKFTLTDEKSAKEAVDRIAGESFTVASIERKQVRRNPPPPFITSTLQQEAARKLRFSATNTMRTAQRLYEGVDIGGETVGLITYMRTDGITLGKEAIEAARKLIGKKFGDNYLPKEARVYKSKVKNAQEAHEAIRPTDAFRTPEQVRQYLSDDEAKLYELIWKRTMASQMENAVLDQVSVDIKNTAGKVVLHATGSIINFDGFLKLYREDVDDTPEGAENEDDRRLPPLKEGDKLKLDSVTPNQHFTQPPPRFTEASLVKRLEELGIGRPSTYASIIQVLQDRDYVKLDQRRFIPESRGRVVTSFLVNFFKKYVEYDFTADLEEDLDEISAGEIEWKKVLRGFWGPFKEAIEKTHELSMTNVIDVLDKELEPYLFSTIATDGDKVRKCPSCADGRLGLKLGRFGAFVGCSNYPECRFTRQMIVSGDAAGDAAAQGDMGPKDLGADPTTGLPVTLRRGPYGPYVQLGPGASSAPPAVVAVVEVKSADGKPKKTRKKKDTAEKPKRAPVPKNMDPADVDLERALALLSLPRDIGLHPETKEVIKAGIGRFGPYLVHQGKFKSIPADDPDGVLTIGLNRAVDLLAQPSRARGAGGASATSGKIRDLGNHPSDAKPIVLSKGRYGPYVRHGSVNATVPKSANLDEITLDQAVEWLAAKESKGPAKSTGRKKSKKG